MNRLRRVLGPVAALWLSCQAGTVALVPLALWLGAPTVHAEECTCGHGDDMTCPMHHKRSGQPSPCAMRAVTDSGVGVLTSLVGIAGFIPEQTAAMLPLDASAAPRLADSHAAGLRPVPPDPPPPRS